MPFVRFIAPTAPSVPSSFGGIGTAWMTASHSQETSLSSLERSRQELLDILELETKAGIPPERQILLGFSLGALLATLTACQTQVRLGGLVLLGAASMELGREAGASWTKPQACQ